MCSIQESNTISKELVDLITNENASIKKDLEYLIKTFESATRNTLDISSVAIIKEYLNIPVIVDPSHAAGRTDIILPLSKASLAVGADGLIIEVHYDPIKSYSDSQQALSFESFKNLISELKL